MAALYMIMMVIALWTTIGIVVIRRAINKTREWEYYESYATNY